MIWDGDMIWFGLVWFRMVWYGMVWYGMVWYAKVHVARTPMVCSPSRGGGARGYGHGRACLFPLVSHDVVSLTKTRYIGACMEEHTWELKLPHERKGKPPLTPGTPGYFVPKAACRWCAAAACAAAACAASACAAAAAASASAAEGAACQTQQLRPLSGQST